MISIFSLWNFHYMYQCSSSPWVCSFPRSNNHILVSSFVIYHRTGAITGSETAYTSGKYEFTPGLLLRFVLPNVFCAVVVDHCLSFYPFSFGHCVVYSFFDLRLLITRLTSSIFSSSFHLNIVSNEVNT